MVIDAVCQLMENPILTILYISLMEHQNKKDGMAPMEKQSMIGTIVMEATRNSLMITIG